MNTQPTRLLYSHVAPTSSGLDECEEQQLADNVCPQSHKVPESRISWVASVLRGRTPHVEDLGNSKGSDGMQSDERGPSVTAGRGTCCGQRACGATMVT